MTIVTIGRTPTADVKPVNGPDWVQANPRWIERAVATSQKKATGGWYVIDASRVIDKTPRKYTIAERELVVFRTSSGVVVGPDACPHMGASLADGRVVGDSVVCPWHGLHLGCEARGSWRPQLTFDDGVLVWVRLDSADELTDRPNVPARPSVALDAVIRMEAKCEPVDVMANRLDPWHGAHFHPYAFARLAVIDSDDESITVRVAKRIAGPVCIEVDARFHTIDARTIVMTIVGGEGVGSVVETHATPLERGRTAIIEANLASSERRSFAVARQLSRLIRPIMVRSARRLWVDDCRYVERLFELRQRDSVRSVGGLHLIK